MLKHWTQIQEQLGKAIVDIGDEVLDKNLHIEMGLKAQWVMKEKRTLQFPVMPGGATSVEVGERRTAYPAVWSSLETSAN
jgi:hypothetical protein